MSINNTGRKFNTFLEQYDVVTGRATGLTKPNVPADPNFIDPVYDETTCPIFVPFTVIADRGLQGATFALSGGKDNQTLTVGSPSPGTLLTQIGRDVYLLTCSLPNNVLSVTVNGVVHTIPQAPLPSGNWSFAVPVAAGAVTVQAVTQPGLFIAGSSTCEQSGTPQLNDGNRAVVTLVETYSLSGALTGVTKPNTIGQPGYLAPFADPVTCPPAQTVTLQVDAGAESTIAQLVGASGQGTFTLAISSGQSGSIRVPAGAYAVNVTVDKTLVDLVTVSGEPRQVQAPYTGSAVLSFSKGPGNIAIVVNIQALVYTGHEPGNCQTGSDGVTNTGYETYSLRDVKYLRSGVLVRSEPNRQGTGYIAPVYNSVLCPQVYQTQLSVYTDAGLSGSTVTHSTGEVLAVSVNTPGNHSLAISRPQADNDTIAVQVPQTVAATVTAGGVTQTVTPAPSGTQTLNFGNLPDGQISVSISAQAQKYIGILPVCEQGVSKTITTFGGPHCIKLWTNGPLRWFFVSNYNSQYVSVIDAATLTKLGDIAIPNMAPGRGVSITALNKVAISTENGSLYIIDPLLGAYGQVAAQSPVNPTYSTSSEFIAGWNAVVIPDQHASALLLCDPTSGAQLSTIAISGTPVTVLQVSSTTVLVGTNDGRVIPVNISTKTAGAPILLEGNAVNGNILSSFSLNQTAGVVYVIGRANKTLYVINLTTMAVVIVRQTAIIDQPYYVPQRNKLYVSANEGTSTVYNGRLYEIETTGYLITNNIFLGAQTRPLYMAYDGVTDDLFVTNYGVAGAVGTTVLLLTPGTHTGRKVFSQLQQVYAGSGTPVSPVTVKNNASGDPDYIAPFTDASCS